MNKPECHFAKHPIKCLLDSSIFPFLRQSGGRHHKPSSHSVDGWASAGTNKESRQSWSVFSELEQPIWIREDKHHLTFYKPLSPVCIAIVTPGFRVQNVQSALSDVSGPVIHVPASWMPTVWKSMCQTSSLQTRMYRRDKLKLGNVILFPWPVTMKSLQSSWEVEVEN